MSTPQTRTALDRTFFVSLILKGLDGAVELVGGLALFVITPAQISAVVRAITRHELREDPHDVIANALVHYTSTLGVATTIFGAVYLLVHGLVKVVLVVAVLRNKLWAYPILIAFLVAFIGYQTVELVINFSVGLLLLTLFDIFIVVLTVREYRLHRSRQAAHAEHASG